MTIAPVRQVVRVKATPPRAFALFTQEIGRWWPKGRTIGAQPHADIVMEPQPGGRWFERSADGAETDWGRVLDWNPPGRLLLAWHLNATFKFDPDFHTEVEILFAPAEGGTTEVTLEHRNLERFGASAADVAAKLGGGWPTMLGHYAEHVATN